MLPDPPGRFSARDIIVLSGEEAVRLRPSAYFGVGRDHPGLPEQVLRSVVQGTLRVPPAHDTLEVVVTIEDDLVFTVRDNGRGVFPHRRHQTRRPDPEEMLTDIHGGQYDRDGQIAVAAAVCGQVKLRTCRQGVAYATELAADRSVSPLRELGPSAAEGTEIQLFLDVDYFVPGARLPLPSRDLCESLMEGRRRATDRLTVVDRRS